MDILKGLGSQHIGAIRHLRGYREFSDGEMIFREGEVSTSLFTIVSGGVQIFRQTIDGEVELARLKAGEVFGEMGLIIDTGQRTASARAIGSCLLMEIGGDPVRLFATMGEPEGAVAFLENLVCILAGRLQKKDSVGYVPVSHTSLPVFSGFQPDPQIALKEVEKRLPRGLTRVFARNVRLREGEFLFHEGGEADGFHFIHSGRLQVLQGNGGSSVRELGSVQGPAMAGEIGFFSGKPRSAGLRGVTEVTHTRFRGSDYRKIVKKNPQEGFQILYASCQLICCLILERERG